jgi:FlaA1/EpsC-like NDP-sugar epimerase
MFEKFTRPTTKKEGTKVNGSLKYHQINNLTEYLEEKKQHQKGKRRFSDKIVIITGASSGIGRATALEFGKEGAKLVIHGQNEERLKETEKLLKNAGIGEERVLCILGQMEKEETVEKIIDETLKKFGGINVLVMANWNWSKINQL